jgi:hypothetical protein
VTGARRVTEDELPSAFDTSWRSDPLPDGVDHDHVPGLAQGEMDPSVGRDLGHRARLRAGRQNDLAAVPAMQTATKSKEAKKSLVRLGIPW